MIPYGHQEVEEEDLLAVSEVLRSNFLTGGPAVEGFESAVAGASHAPHCVAVSNGTAALRLLYRVAGIGPGKRVGVPAITFVATASQALDLGADVVLLDVDPATGLLTPEILHDAPEDLDVVVAVHIGGQMCDLPALSEIAKRRGLILLEDGAHAFGSIDERGDPCGSCRHSEGAAFSFHPVKNITTGEGGAITVGRAAWEKELRSLRHHGILRNSEDFTGPISETDGSSPWYHEFLIASENYRLSAIHAALGSSQIKRLNNIREERNRIRNRYEEAFRSLPHIKMIPRISRQNPCWHLAQAHLQAGSLGTTRSEVFAAATKHGIGLQVHYIPLSSQPLLEGSRGWNSCEGATEFYENLISIPIYAGLDPSDQDRVIEFFRTLFSQVGEDA